jgi:hypothetical protein
VVALPRKKTLYALANERISFDKAMEWAGQAGTVTRERGVKAACPSCGEDRAMRVYPNHGWCFAEQKYFSPVGLLAEVWDLDREDAARKALDRIGYAPPGYAELWESAQREPVPALDDLATALRLYCERVCPDWAVRQYEDGVSDLLARCLGTLRAVRTEDDCRKWLAVTKTAMSCLLSQP